METHFPGCKNLEADTQSGGIFRFSECISGREISEVVSDIVSMDKVVWAVNTFEPYKSPGYRTSTTRH